MAEKINIRKRIDFDDVWWAGVLDLLVKRFGMPFEQASVSLRRFFGRFRRIFNLYWYTHRILSEEDNRIVAAICECHGADVITLVLQRSLSIGIFNIDYHQMIEFEPRFRRDEAEAGKGALRPRIEVRVGRRLLTFSTLWGALFFYFLATLVAVVVSALLVGLFLYGLAVFLLFIVLPIDVTIAATRFGPIGVALLCFLVGGAALFGRAIKNVWHLLRQRWRRYRGQL